MLMLGNYSLDGVADKCYKRAFIEVIFVFSCGEMTGKESNVFLIEYFPESFEIIQSVNMLLYEIGGFRRLIAIIPGFMLDAKIIAGADSKAGSGCFGNVNENQWVHGANSADAFITTLNGRFRRWACKGKAALLFMPKKNLP